MAQELTVDKDIALNISLADYIKDLDEVVVNASSRSRSLSSPQMGVEKLSTKDIKYIPVLLGEKSALLICQGILAAYLLLLFLFTDQFDSNFFGLTLTIILSGWLIFRSKWEKNEYYYFLYLDGTMILQFLTLLLFSSINL